MRIALAGLLWLGMTMAAARPSAQDVRNTSSVDTGGERVLRFEVTVDATVQRAWSAFSTTAGLSSWLSTEAIVDFKAGGAVTPRDRSRERIGDTGAARLDIVSYREPATITFHVRLDDTFSETIREQDDDLRQTVELAPLGDKTAIAISMSGWGKGRIWDDAYAFFARRIESASVRLVSTLSAADAKR